MGGHEQGLTTRRGSNIGNYNGCGTPRKVFFAGGPWVEGYSLTLKFLVIFRLITVHCYFLLFSVWNLVEKTIEI